MNPFALYFVLTTFALMRANAQEKVNITVYYEVLCPDSIKFIQTQLHPTWKQLRDYMNVEFVPYGKASKKKNQFGIWEFNCQHGEEECFGNKMQACAFNQFKNNSELSMEYVRCSVNYPFRRTCFQEMSKDIMSVRRFEQCIYGFEGDEILAKYGDMTPSLSFVPTVTFNVKNYKNADQQARQNLKSTVCSMINVKPPICTQ